MEVHSMRLDHGPIQTNNMSYSQRQPPNHRPNHSAQAAAHVPAELYKPSRSPLSSTRCPYPPSPQLQPAPTNITQVQIPQRYPPQGSAASAAAPTTYHRHPDYRHTNRISLLHQPTQTHSSEQLLKKIRLADKDVQPLRIDTRPGSYNPQVEAISPILPEQVSQEEIFKVIKEELIQGISKVDREILKVEQQIVILKKEQAELEEVASKPSVKAEVEEDTQPKHQSLAQKIYAENRKKAQSAHALLDSLGPKVEWPLYNQPTDTTVFHENKQRNEIFSKRLIECFKKAHTEKFARNNQLTSTYSKLMQEWLRKVDKIESSTKRKVKEAKNREFFEKVFPELRKQREDKERFNRVGARVKSEADMEEIMDNLQEQALEDKKMRSYAVIPPILLDAKERRIKYTNNNNAVEDMKAVYKSRQYLNIWTASEKDTFKEKYLQHPKNFYQISQTLGDRKSVSDCVQYYYLSKKTENYKRLLRKNKRDKLRERLRSTRNNPQKVNNSANVPVGDSLTTGVTTRLQREQQQRTGGAARTAEASTAAAAAVTADAATTGNSSSPPIPLGTTATPSPLNVGGTTTTSTATSSASGATASTSAASTGDWTTTNSSTTQVSCSMTSSSPTTASVTVTSVISTTASTSLSLTSSTISVTATPTSSLSTSGVVPMDTSGGEDETKDPKSVVKFNDFNSFEDYNNRQKSFGDTPNATNSATADQDDPMNAEQKDRDGHFEKEDTENTTTSEANCENASSLSVPENKKKKERRKDKENAVETSDEEAASLQDKIIQGNCVVCNAQLGPQLHSRPLQPSQASQYGLREDQVPLNSRVCNTCRCKCVRSRYTHCPLSTCPNARGRVKRLRSFPYRLQDLPSDVRDPILAEFRIPSGVTKCCSACFNRIQRRLGPVEEWPDEDVSQLKSVLTELGANWQLVGERLNKLPHQVRSFYAANRKRLNLENCLGDRKPTLTDEEESGSSTSSCEEPLRERERHSSDTTSAAESPPVMQGQNQNAVKKEDYDSSATETADEAQTPDHYQTATITPVANDYQARPEQSVKELLMNVIEISLNKNPGGQQAGAVQGSAMAPTISSILNNDSNEVTIVSEYNLNTLPNRSQPLQSRADISLTKLANTIGATITPVSGPIRTQPQPEPIQSSRDDLVVVQVPDTRDSIPETLDLSIKKPREPMPPTHSKHPPSTIHRSEPTYIFRQERKSPAYIRTSQVKLPSPQPANPKSGSITLGTPIINPPTRYDGLLRQIPDAKMGSITKGTPIHTSHSLQQDKRVYDYFTKQGRIPSQQNMAPQPQYQHAQRPSYEQPINSQMSSRQIIIDDYYTSQQMHSRQRQEPQYYPTNSPHRTPPPQQSQQRQGVIQRHTRPQYHPPPGHEALSSLVDIAVQQPSLPVPSAPHEGLGKTIADNIMEQPHRFQIMHQQQLRQQQQRIDEQRRAFHQQQQQQQQQQVRAQPRTDPSTMTAASLIDAIITHQINQTAEGSRGDVVPNPREPPRASDLLFQSFQRDPPISQDNNGVRPPSVISLDLDGDGVNKNLTVKELTDSVISHDFNTRPDRMYYQLQENVSEQWKRRVQQQKDETKRSATPQQQAAQQQQQQQDERQIIRIAQPQKYHHEPVSPPENNHWLEMNMRRYQQPQSHISPLDYVKNRIVEVMRTEDDKKDVQDVHVHEKDRSDSPGEMVIDEEKHENDFSSQQQEQQHQQQARQHQQPQGAYPYPYVHKDTANDNSRNNEPKPLLSAQYEPLSDED